MATDPETLYQQLGRLIQTMPDLEQVPLTEDVYEWTAQAYALVAEAGDAVDAGMFKLAMNNQGASLGAVHQIKAIVYRTFAVMEMRVPAGVAGSFIPVGDAFDAYTALSKVLQTATMDVLIVDPYMDETALTDFGSAVPEGVRFRLMADNASCKPTLQPAALRWVEQYGAARPLSVRLAPPRCLHDRAIFVDQKVAWTLTQSLKDFATRSPAEIVRADDTAELKIAAYEEIWSSAGVIIE